MRRKKGWHILKKEDRDQHRAIASEKASLIQSRLDKEIDEKTFNKKWRNLNSRL